MITNQEKFDNRKLLHPKTKRAWVEALRSGEYSQGKFQLNDDGNFTFNEIADIFEKYF